MELQEKYEKVRKAADDLYRVMKTSNEYVIFEYWNKLGDALRETEEKTYPTDTEVA
jgi:uncharacterized FlaG/YvyC family protein